MTSFRQIEANRRNAGKSTGPVTEEGKQRSRCNAVRHGLTAETVIGALEDAEDYTNTVCQFQYPSSSSWVYSYPNVTYGRNQYNNPPSFSAAPTSARIANLTELTIDYNFTADRVSPPSVHQMVLTLERTGFIRRQPRTPRSIELLIDPKQLPELL